MPHGRATVYRLVLVLSLVLMGTPLALLAPPTTVGAEQPVEIVDLAPPRADETVTVRRGNQTVTFRPLKTVRLADGQEVVANRLVVGFHATVGAAERAAAHQQAGARGGLKARVVGPLGPAAQVIDVGGTVTLEAALQAYRADPRVRFAEPDSIERAFETPNDSFFDDQWGMAVIQAPTAWNTTHGSTARKIAILDCGIYEAGSSLPNGFPGHDDLNGKVVARRDFTGSATGSDDYCDHGTHVAGIASAITNNATGVSGVGWDTRLINAKVLSDNGSGSSTQIAQGIYWATDNGAHVINMSLGSNAPCTSVFQDAINYAFARNVVVVAAAGNDNLSSPHRPASCANTLAVASTDANDTKSDFSSWGASWVDVAAPGGDDGAGNSILSTDYFGDYVYKAGTSMAAPHVAGLAGLLWGTNRFSTAQEVVNRITGSATAVAGTGLYWQYGRVNAAAAVVACAPVTLPNAPSPGDGALTWYFAEGYTGTGFDEYLTILNPNGTAAAVTITYYLASGATATASLAVAANSRSTVNVHEPTCGVGRGQAVSAKVASTNNVGIVAERPMYFTYSSSGLSNISGGHNVMGATAPSTSWYFAEGYTGPGFEQYFTVMNPNPTDAPVAITYYLANGTTQLKNVTVAANSRKTVVVHDATEGVGRGQAVSAKLSTTNAGGIVVERAMYFSYNGSVTNITGGHNVMGATAPHATWYFAEGYTGAGFDQYFTIMNPNPTVAPVTIIYYLATGASQTATFDVAPNSRKTVVVHDPTEGVGRGQAVSAKVTTTNVDGIVVERPMYFTYTGSGISGVTGGHIVMGANEPGPTWFFAEGYTGAGFNEYLTIMNPNLTAATVTITYFYAGGGSLTKVVTVNPNSRYTAIVHGATDGVGPNQAIAAKVTTTNAGGIVVERPMYFNYNSTITGGHNVMGFQP